MGGTALPRHVVVVGALVRNDEGDVLLIRHQKRGWEIPQGKVEEGEGLIEALLREILEETGVEIEPGPLGAVYSKIVPPSAVVFGFLARWRGGEPTPCDECPEVGWFSPEEALEKVVNPTNLDRLKSLLGYKGQVIFRSYGTSPFTIHSEAVLGGE